jgi:hypothetical protein
MQAAHPQLSQQDFMLARMLFAQAGFVPLHGVLFLRSCCLLLRRIRASVRLLQGLVRASARHVLPLGHV